MDIPKNKLSAVFITFNEIINIDEVIENVSFADEIIIVDSFSTDGTAECIKLHPKVSLIQRPFKDYTDQKSFAMSQASNDWVLFMDADERLTDALRKEIVTTINSDSKEVAYYFYRTFMFQKEVLRFSGWQSDKNFRLFRKSKVNFVQERVVHETLEVDGKIGILKNKLIHYSYKDYQDYKGKMIKYGQMKAQEELDKNYAPNLYHFVFRPLYKFFNHYILRFGFLDGKKGIIISYLNALGVSTRYKELKRLRQIEKNTDSTNSSDLDHKPIIASKDQLKFLVIQQKMIGDVLASTIICESLKHHFPNAEVHLVANENTLPVLEGNPFIDSVIVFKKEYRESKLAFYRFLKSLKKTKYSAVIDAYGKLESNLITLFAKSNRKISRHKWYTSWVYSDSLYQNQTGDNEIPLAISNRLMLLNPIIKDNNYLTYPRLFLSDEEQNKARKIVENLKDSEQQKVIMVGILGSGPDKTYPANYMAELLDAICDNRDIKLLFNYIPSQKKEAIKIYELCSLETQDHIEIDFYANSLRDFMSILSQCDMLFGNEGGTVNMAKALDIPSFCIFSPFIVKGAWHGKVYHNHESVHLRDYHAELFGYMDKREIKRKTENLYQAFKPELFKEYLLNFLNKNMN
ncbi:MAG: glycosyltransferase [Maribacter sp.]